MEHPEGVHARGKKVGVLNSKALIRLDEGSGATGCAFDTLLFGGENFHR